MVRPRVRIRFSKQSALRLIGHRDLMRSLERLFRRAGLSLGMSEGYRPKPRMNFPLALAVGMEGRREVMELELHETPSADELLARLQTAGPRGAAFRVAGGPAAGQSQGPGGQRLLPHGSSPVASCRTGRTESSGCSPHPRCPSGARNRSAPIDVGAALVGAGAAGRVLEMRLKTDPGGSAGPRDVLAALGLEDLEHQGTVLTRSDVEIDS